jgi:hypothetical protein
MSAQSCTPPASLTLWAAALLAGTFLWVIVALALAPLQPGRWRWRTLSALLALALAGWSLTLLSRVQAAYDALASQNQLDPYYCWWSGMHGPPRYQFWLKQTAQMIAPLQRQALITTSATVALLLVVVALIALRWLRGGRRMRRAAAAPAAGAISARPRWRLGRGRALALLLLFALIIADLGEFTLIQIRSVQAQMALTAPCRSTMTAADVLQIQAAGISLIPTHDTMPVDAQAARTASRQGLSQPLPSDAACVTPQLDMVEDSSVAEVPRFAIVWVVGYRIPGAVAGSGVLATPPSEEWTFVDAQSGAYLYGMFMSSVGG